MAQFVSVTVLPAKLRLGDLLVTGGDEWEVIAGPWRHPAGKHTTVLVQRPEDRDSRREITLPTDEPITAWRRDTRRA
jgi:hypothetical protein